MISGLIPPPLNEFDYKDSEFSRGCQAAAGYLTEGSAAICKLGRLYYFPAYDIRPRQPGAGHPVDRATPEAPRREGRYGRRPTLVNPQ
jgi:hypothetical protein